MLCLLAWCNSISDSAAIEDHSLSDFGPAKSELISNLRLSTAEQQIPLKRFVRQTGNVGPRLTSIMCINYTQ